MRKVVVLQHRLLHYRLQLFESLRARCADKGIELHLVHGQPTRREEGRRDVGLLSWADSVCNRYLSVGRRDLVWQPFPTGHRDADLIVVMQENRLLSNYPLLFGRARTRPKVAYWGHGRNFQTDRPTGILERWKKLMVGRVDWWFGYTEMTRDILLADGYPDERITVLNNAIDNEGFQKDLESVTDERLGELRAEIGADELSVVGLFCGSLYPDKRLGYMIEAADRIQAEVPDFRLVVIGDGPSGSEIKSAAAERPWLKWMGIRKGLDKAAFFRLADIVLNPGLVGLHILDSFCAGVPMVTTDDARHSPEIAYLEDGRNGLVVHGGPDRYAEAVVKLLRDRRGLKALSQAACQAAERYTLQSMVENFTDGIERCLAMPRKR